MLPIRFESTDKARLHNAHEKGVKLMHQTRGGSPRANNLVRWGFDASCCVNFVFAPFLCP